MPETGPILPDRPGARAIAQLSDKRLKALAYSGETKNGSLAALERMVEGELIADDVITSWKRTSARSKRSETPVFAGTFTSSREVTAIRQAWSKLGIVEMETSFTGGAELTSLKAWPKPGVSTDDLLKAAWAAGASDAMILRD